MDPSLIHKPSSISPPPRTSEDSKPPLPHSNSSGLHRGSTSTLRDLGHGSDESGSSDNDDHDADDRAGGDGAKRPRLRLAHACDRCRKRKIRCDTQQPCGPCQATRNECTFNTPSRRVTKPKGSEHRSTSTSGIKRPHSPPGSARIAALGGEGQANLEARLAALEAMLGDVPPKVHNAFLSSLDARLGSGSGVGISQGKSEGVAVALEALAGGSSGSNLESLLKGIGGNWDSVTSNLGANSTLSPGWANGLAGPSSWSGAYGKAGDDGVNDMAKRMEGMSFFYEDEIGQAKWQGATSGFPLLDLLTATSDSPAAAAERSASFSNTFAASPENVQIPGNPRRTSTTSTQRNRASPSRSRDIPLSTSQPRSRFFPDRTPRPHQTLNPEASWKVITGVIPSDLMDTLVRCYLSTSHLLWPFLHVPSFLQDYANPQQWGEPGFACFIVSVCTLSSRHVDDPRVRANPQDPSTAGKRYFELFKRLRDLPSADRPTLYSIQAAFLAAIYAFGLGNLSKAFALLAESITLCLDGGLHRSVDGYDHFDFVEKETRKRTFWSIYAWDKQSAALFGRPPIIHLRDCDVTEPLIVDDEDLKPDKIIERGKENNSRMCAFVAAIRLHVVLEGVIDAATQPSSFPTSPFLARASASIAKRAVQSDPLRDQEALLEEWKRLLPKYWHYDAETANSRDPIRITQAERLHCLEHLVKMIIYRHQFSGFVSVRTSTPEEKNTLLEICRKAMQCALTIIADHVHISQRGMMTYYGVHVIHQLAQAGRTLVAVILNCRNGDFRPMIAPCIEGLRSCVGLLRRFSGRYLCGLRSADIIDEFCRICNIPVDSPRVPDGTGRPSPAWLRPVRKRLSPSPAPQDRTGPSPSSMMDYMGGSGDIMSNPAVTGMPSIGTSAGQSNDLEALFNTSEYFDLSAMSPPQSNDALPPIHLGGLGEASAPFDTLEGFAANVRNNGNLGSMTLSPGAGTGMASGQEGSLDGQNGASLGGQSMDGFDFGKYNAALNTGAYGAGGETLAGEGMDSVSDGLKGNVGQGLSAATILSLLEEGSFDYGSVFTDQAPLPMDFEGSI